MRKFLIIFLVVIIFMLSAAACAKRKADTDLSSVDVSDTVDESSLASINNTDSTNAEDSSDHSVNSSVMESSYSSSGDWELPKLPI